MKTLEELEEKIGYCFVNKNLLQLALTHTSYANENRSRQSKSKPQNNERLEFLGDSVLNLIITSYLFNTLEKVSEGDMSRIRSTIVCEKSLKMSADRFGLKEYIFLGKGEEITGGRNRDSIIADAMEALIGAIYLDSGMESAKCFIQRFMTNTIELALDGKLFKDYKTQFQEIVQKNKDAKIQYHVIAEKGPDHNKLFIVELKLDGKKISSGRGRNKKEAEQNAAREAIERERI